MKFYKAIHVLLAILVIVSFAYTWASYWYIIIPWCYFFYKYLKTQFAVKHIEYDDSSFYVNLPNYDLQVRFEEVESIEILSLTGVYRINLFEQSMLGKEIYFKPSLLYPLNYKKVDKVIDQLRREVLKSRRKISENPSMQLNSLNL